MGFDDIPHDPSFEPSFYDSMIADETRNAGFRRAIDAVVTPGAVVADVGTGLGVLALFAARAGAGKVYAIDRKPWVAPIVRALADANGYADVIEVVIADGATVRLPQPVDVVVSETLGNAGVDEGIQAIVDGFARENLKPGGVVVPSRVRCMAAPFETTPLLEGLRARSFSDLDMSPLERLPMSEVPRAGTERIAARPLAAPAILEEVHPGAMAAVSADPLRTTFSIERDGMLRSIVLWFEADLAPDHLPDDPPLTNGFGVAGSSWPRRIQLSRHPMPVAAGNRIALAAETNGRGNCINWTLTWRRSSEPG